MSAQRARSTVAAEGRSAHPEIPGVPWWGAILIAVAATFAGFAIDAGSGNKELTFLFGALYAIGCVAAVIAVRQSGIFTAVVQPPLILFVAVPTAYFLFHRAEIDDVKDVLINCGYPLIERFPLMFTTSVVVLLIGMARWYFGAADQSGTATPKAGVGASLVAGIGVKSTAMRNRRSVPQDEDTEESESPKRARRPRRHTIDDPSASVRRPRERRTTGQRGAPTTSRHARPPMDDLEGPSPRRGRPAGEYRSRDREAPEPPKRSRRPSRHQSAYEPHEPYGSYEPSEPYDAAPPPSTHLPYSNVRYRDGTDDEDDRRHRRPRPR